MKETASFPKQDRVVGLLPILSLVVLLAAGIVMIL